MMSFMKSIRKQLEATQRVEQLLAMQVRQELLEPYKTRPKDLVAHGWKAYSQNDEDGIIQEIFRRIGVKSNSFIEVGAGDGKENNTLYLLTSGWKGAWVEGSSGKVQRIKNLYEEAIKDGRLQVFQKFVIRDNLKDFLGNRLQSPELDLFSLDLDGNDFHILEAIDQLKARVVVLEYNAKFRPPIEWVMPYNAQHSWDGSDHYGASLQSFTELMTQKGYQLVGCNLTGVNAFYVRKDLLADHFSPESSAEYHFQPPRYWLTPSYNSGHPISSHQAPVIPRKSTH